jgi:O-antigen/teichoic acid export membrane protein
LSSIKQLAGQTLWYGVPTIVKRFIGYITNLALPLFFAQPAKTADLTQIYAIFPFLNVLFTYGLETAYFKFSQTADQKKLYNTLSISLLVSTIILSIVLFLFSGNIIKLASLEENPEFVHYMIVIVIFDSLSALAFAKLRQENRPRRYAFAQLATAVAMVIVVLIFLGVIPHYLRTHPSNAFLDLIYNKKIGAGYYLIGNIIGSILTFLILQKEFTQIRFKFDKELWKEVMKYSMPLIIVGMGGMINDMMSRLIYQHVVDLPPAEAKHQLGIFGNIYRLAVLITIMIQAFRMAAEPFFFNQSGGENPQKIYARVMKFFVIVCSFMFLLISLYIDLFAWFFKAIHRQQWVEGLGIVPILALGNIFLGIYYNLSIWYKLTNKNMTGAIITVLGAVITIVLNVLLIPKYHYLGAAIATFSCYLFMMISSYVLGQKYYPVPYPIKKLIRYLVIIVSIYGAHRILVSIWGNNWFNVASATLLLVLFTFFITKQERKEFAKLPAIGKYFSR